MRYHPQTIEDSGGAAWDRVWRRLNKDSRIRQVRPNYRPRREHSYSINSLGFRCPEFSEIDWSNAVVWVGDSYTVGIGVRAEHTLPGLCNNWAGQNHINCGRGGASNGRIYSIATDIVQYKPRALICNWSSPSRLWSNGVDCAPWNMSLSKSKFPQGKALYKLCTEEYRTWVLAGRSHHNATTLQYVDDLSKLCGDRVLHISTGFRNTAELLGQTWFEKPNHILDYSYDGSHHSERINRRHVRHIKPWLNTI